MVVVTSTGKITIILGGGWAACLCQFTAFKLYLVGIRPVVSNTGSAAGRSNQVIRGVLTCMQGGIGDVYSGEWVYRRWGWEVRQRLLPELDGVTAWAFQLSRGYAWIFDGFVAGAGRT